jgi:hypothetical protein
MLFSRRKRATAVGPSASSTSPSSNGAAVDDAVDEISSVDLTPMAADFDDTPATVVTTASGVPTVLVTAPTTTPSPTEGLESFDGARLAPGDETGDADLDRFFAALRQVVRETREQLPLESDQFDEPETVVHAFERGPTQPDDAGTDATAAGAMVVTNRDPATSTDLASSTTELAPTTAELIASLEEDRDRWRERAVVWRERAMGADMLVKSLNAHNSDLHINLEDLRMALRVMGSNNQIAPEPRAALADPTARQGALDRFTAPGN